MAKEILSIPEEYLDDVIGIIRDGLRESGPWRKLEARECLENWCDEVDAYLTRIETP